MSTLAPRTIQEAVDALGEHPDADVLAGGTDLMVEVNAGVRRPSTVVSLHRIDELRGWRRDGDEVELGAALTYRELEQGPLAELVPVLAQAARTVGSPQIRNAGTVGGNVCTASPAGDTLPPLAALDATVVLAGPDGRRTVALLEFVTGPKRTDRRPDELVVAVRVPVLDGPQEYLKVGTRNAMVISVAGVAFVVDRAGRTVRCALGSVAAVPVRATDAEAWLATRVNWDASRPAIADPEDVARFAVMVAADARPITDHRSTAEYRRHAVQVCARRAAERCLR